MDRIANSTGCHWAMHRNDARELGEALLATVKRMQEGPTPLQ
jgi:hypothetical protein